MRNRLGHYWDLAIQPSQQAMRLVREMQKLAVAVEYMIVVVEYVADILKNVMQTQTVIDDCGVADHHDNVDVADNDGDEAAIIANQVEKKQSLTRRAANQSLLYIIAFIIVLDN